VGREYAGGSNSRRSSRQSRSSSRASSRLRALQERAAWQAQAARTAAQIKQSIMSEVSGSGAGFVQAFKIFRRKAADDGDGQVDFAEFRRALRFMNLDISEAEAQVVFDAVDTDGSGSIDYSEFCDGFMDKTGGLSLDGNLGEEHATNQARRQREQAAKLMTALDTEDPVTAIREHVMASVEGPGAMLKAFKIFRKKSNSLNNSITFREFAHGLHHMNVKLSATKMKMFFDSLDSNRSGEIDFAEFTAGIMRQANGGDRTSLR
jgi:Ca2+-binding EF-hand superfamily protein